jgi:hypothetical protein
MRPAGGNYPFPGADSFGFVNADEVPGFEPARDLPNVRGAAAGARLFKVVLENVRMRDIEVRQGVAAERLIVEGGRVTGVHVVGGSIAATGGVVLATGGFEGSAELQRQFWSMNPVLSAAMRTNTGDGLRLAPSVGTQLWHMWHYHGSYGFAHPALDYPFGIRLKRLPDWRADQGLREDVTMSWILLDRRGRRFMNEYEPYMQDTGHRALEGFDFARLAPACIPALLVVDAAGYGRYALSAPTWHDAEVAGRYRDMPARAFDDAILQSFETLDLPPLSISTLACSRPASTNGRHWRDPAARIVSDARGRGAIPSCWPRFAPHRWCRSSPTPRAARPMTRNSACSTRSAPRSPGSTRRGRSAAYSAISTCRAATSRNVSWAVVSPDATPPPPPG